MYVFIYLLTCSYTTPCQQRTLRSSALALTAVGNRRRALSHSQNSTRDDCLQVDFLPFQMASGVDQITQCVRTHPQKASTIIFHQSVSSRSMWRNCTLMTNRGCRQLMYRQLLHPPVRTLNWAGCFPCWPQRTKCTLQDQLLTARRHPRFSFGVFVCSLFKLQTGFKRLLNETRIPAIPNTRANTSLLPSIHADNGFGGKISPRTSSI